MKQSLVKTAVLLLWLIVLLSQRGHEGLPRGVEFGDRILLNLLEVGHHDVHGIYSL